MLTRSALLFLLVVAVGLGQGGPRASLRERAAKGDPEAQFNLAKNYEAGRAGLKIDLVEAERWYRRAAEQGDPFAQASLAILYRFGKGVAVDHIEAYMWFYLASNRTTGDDRQSIVDLQESTEARMTADQVAEAVRRARLWKPKAPQ